MSFRITVSGSAKFELEGFARRLERLEQPTAEATLFMERQTKLRFAQQVSPDGASWAPLAPSTLAKKKTSAILRETATLVNSITSQAMGLTGKVFTPTEYGLYHQTGTSKMPARVFLGISAEDETKIRKIYEQYIQIR